MADNGPVLRRRIPAISRTPAINRTRALVAVAVALVPVALAGCGGSGAIPGPATSSAPATTVPVDARGRLALAAARAQDLHFAAAYRWTASGRPARTVTVVLALDGSWAVTLPASAMSGTADIVMSGVSAGTFQCVVRPQPACVLVAVPGATVPRSVDPQVEHLFTDWLNPMTDLQAAISAAAAPLLPGARGSCYDVESNAASLPMPLAAGVYCFLPDGTLTGASVSFGTIIQTGPIAPAPPTVTLPGPVVKKAALPTTAPSASASSGRG